MLEKVKKTITEYDLFPKAAKIVVGVSGGADSVCLLHLLDRMREEREWQLLAVHVHHGLRGEEADAAFEEIVEENGGFEEINLIRELLYCDLYELKR